MFTHNIQNPNNINIDTQNFHAIPFGHRCTSAMACTYASIRHFSLPFDWTIPSLPNKIQDVLADDFANFIPDVTDITSGKPVTTKYGIGLAHFNLNIVEGVGQYKRRVERFRKIITEKEKFLAFIYMNEDYLHSPYYRNEKKIFDDMVKLEKFMREKYELKNYTILFFGFESHNIPSDSNIIIIHLTSEQFYPSEDSTPLTIFRPYCGKILSEIFGSLYHPVGNNLD